MTNFANKQIIKSTNKLKIMSKKTKAFLYNLAGFMVFFVPTWVICTNVFGMEGFLPKMIALVISIFLSPKFQYVKTNEGDKIFMKWLFIKGIKEVK